MCKPGYAHRPGSRSTSYASTCTSTARRRGAIKGHAGRARFWSTASVSCPASPSQCSLRGVRSRQSKGWGRSAPCTRSSGRSSNMTASSAATARLGRSARPSRWWRKCGAACQAISTGISRPKGFRSAVMRCGSIGEPQIEPNRVADDLGREAVTIVGNALHPLPYLLKARVAAVSVTEPTGASRGLRASQRPRFAISGSRLPEAACRAQARGLDGPPGKPFTPVRPW
jgi:hypothetical protein